METTGENTSYSLLMMNNKLEMWGWGGGKSTKSLPREKHGESAILPSLNVSDTKISSAAK